MENISSDYVIQVHSTSPLITPESIIGFAKNLVEKEIDGAFSTEKLYSECIIQGNPKINFSFDKKTKTQDLIPVEKISWALSGWKKKIFFRFI